MSDLLRIIYAVMAHKIILRQRMCGFHCRTVGFQAPESWFPISRNVGFQNPGHWCHGDRNTQALLYWLKGMSVAKLFDWFDAIQKTTIDSLMGRARWRTEAIERDRLFLSRIGVLES